MARLLVFGFEVVLRRSEMLIGQKPGDILVDMANDLALFTAPKVELVHPPAFFGIAQVGGRPFRPS